MAETEVRTPEILAGSYDMKKVILTIDGVPARGWGTGDALTIAWDTDDWTDSSGAGGEVIRAKTNDYRATVTIKLMASSRAIKQLADKRKLGRTAGTGDMFSLGVKDLNSNTSYKAVQAWVLRQPDRTVGPESVEVEFRIRCASLKGDIQPIEPTTTSGGGGALGGLT